MRTRSKRALKPSAQIAIAGIALSAAISLFLVPSVFGRRPAAAVAQALPAPIPTGFFRPTDDQWQSLTIAPVARMAFGAVSESEGTIAPADDTTTQVLSPFTGRVTRVFVTVGDRVHAGQPLFAGESGEYAQAVNDLAAAQQTLHAAQTQLAVTQANRAHLVALLRAGGAAKKDVEQSRADVATALATVRNDRTAIALVLSRLRILGDGGALVAAAASGRASEPLRTSVVVRAPVGGVVVQRAVGAGQNVDSAANGDANPLLTITDLSRVFFVANARESEIGQVAPGDAVAVRMLAFPGHVFHARVKYVSPTVDPSTHRIAVRAEVENPDGSLKPGMFGSFAISTGAPAPRLGVPEDAVIYEGDTARVWIAGPRHSLALRYIRAGKTVDGMVEVLHGLAAGDRVVTRGSVFIDRASEGDS